MPFLPLYLQQLGVRDVGEVAMWSGLSLGVTPAMTALLAPFWGRLSDRFGRKIMVERSLVSFIFLMAAMAYVTRPWHVFALRAVQGLFAGYGALALTMAAESAPRERTAYAIGTVQTAQRLGPALGPIIGGVVAQMVGLRSRLPRDLRLLRRGAAARVLHVRRAARPPTTSRSSDAAGRVRFSSVLAFENFVLLMAVIFGLQFVDRSFGPILPLYRRRARHARRPGAARRRTPLLDRGGGRRASAISCARRLLRARDRHARSSAPAALRRARRARLRARADAPAWLFAATPVFGLAHRRRDDGGLHRGQQR